MSASMKTISACVCQNVKRHLLKNYSSPQYVPSCTVVRASGIKRPGKGPVVNKPDFIRPAHGRKVKRLDGQFVHRGDVLVTQNGLNYYPGENVEIERTNRLVAMCDGTVMITTETLNPYQDSPLYAPVSQGTEIKRKFFHVYPIPLHGKFRLVNAV
ncbi:large ribosomal subunit protein bL27m-like [Mytilus galloprovincialis]|uniref:Large subunit ribosomal protein L27 n=2 Tax=Mytilus TaxID=6548 RepID=A0A8B6G1D4_MYTGA|nr:MRPL27 [Mytilus edulis]VDI57340.1 large subunit ribosomal protein L27 [Mytilus galloprovincialis]